MKVVARSLMKMKKQRRGRFSTAKNVLGLLNPRTLWCFLFHQSSWVEHISVLSWSYFCKKCRKTRVRR